MERITGKPCSANFVFKKQIEDISELWEILQTKESIFWNHRMFPCSVIMQQKLTTIKSALNAGRFWDTISSK